METITLQLGTFCTPLKGKGVDETLGAKRSQDSVGSSTLYIPPEGVRGVPLEECRGNDHPPVGYVFHPSRKQRD